MILRRLSTASYSFFIQNSIAQNQSSLRPVLASMMNRKQSIQHHALFLRRKSLSSFDLSNPIRLPNLPVPSLEESLEHLKSSAGPHAVNQEEFTEFMSIVNQFGKKTGPKLRELLLQKASQTSNWLSSDWWVNKAYLEGRDPLMIWSNPGLICPRIESPSNGREAVIKHVSHLIMAVLDFRSFLKRGDNPEPGVQNQCMDQYQKVFGTTRIPGKGKDSINFGNLQHNNDKLSIIVSRRGNFFKVSLPNNEESDKENFLFLTRVVNSILYSEDDLTHSSLGTLTALPRDKWANTFTKLDSNSVNSIIESEFVVSLDEVSNDFDNNWSENMARQILHGDSNNAGNRWFDKTIQLIVVLNQEKNRVIGSGFCYEHTPAEGPPIVRLMEHSMKYLARESASGDWPLTDLKKWSLPSPLHSLTQLPLASNQSEIQEAIKEAAEHHASFSSSLDLRILDFTDFGKKAIKGFKMSPDSFIQVAICWAYFRLHKKVGGCYESASSRMFSLGRTECIRSVTPAFFELAQNPRPSRESLIKAVDQHKQTVKNAMTGKGIDRLLLGMNAAAQEVKNNQWTWGSPPFALDSSDYQLLDKLYKNELFLRCKYFLLSTSQVATVFPESFMDYGPLVSDGYGCCYNPSSERITFAISSFNSKYAKLDTDVSSSNADKYKSCLKETLLLMRDLLSSNGPSISSKL